MTDADPGLSPAAALAKHARRLTVAAALTVVAALAGLVIMAGPARADINHGMAAYNKKDYATARTEFTAAAKAGDARAKLSLAMMYIRGQGVERDFDLAVRWLREAAGQGDGDARMVLGDLYSRDIPSIQDYVKSYVWLTLALKKVRADKRATALKLRHKLQPRMSPQQIKIADRLVEQWNRLDQ
jgi:TPR repeat protein